jgi:hypothetical protein
MTVKEIPVNIHCIEYRQQSNDPDYGSCLYARFYLNCDKYEMTIISDCGNYGYKWVETPDSESFLKLVSRMDGGYLLNKLYGQPDILDFEKTKEHLIEDFSYNSDNEEKEKFIQILNELEYEPDNENDFINLVENECEYNDLSIDTETIYYSIEKTYPSNILKIIEIFEQNIQPFVKQLL